MRYRLYSDFIDYYDHYFDSDGIRFERFTYGGMNRIDMLKWLSKNYPTVQHGYVDKIPPTDYVVVYTNPKAHMGEGKILLPYNEAIMKYPNYYCSEFVKCGPKSTRLLYAGRFKICLEYSSDDDWRSNCSNVNTTILSIEVGDPGPAALCAIDFVRGLAVDYNIAPGLGCVEHELKADNIANAIKEDLDRRAIS